MKDSLDRTKSVATAITTGQMENPMQATGQKIRWTAKVFLVGKTVKNMKETL